MKYTTIVRALTDPAVLDTNLGACAYFDTKNYDDDTRHLQNVQFSTKTWTQ